LKTNDTRYRFHVKLTFASALLSAFVCELPAVAQEVQSSATPTLSDPTRVAKPIERVLLTAGRSTVVSTEFAISRIAVTDPEVADAVVVEPREVLIDGKKPGTVSLIVWGSGNRVQYDLVVDPGVTTLQQKLQALFPGENIQVSNSDEAIILSGNVSNNQTMLRAAEIAQATSSKAKVVNLLQLPGGMDSQQVMLQVRFAEVNRRALQEVGASLFTGPTGFKDWIGRSTTQQFAAPDFEDLGRTEVNGEVVSLEGKINFSDFLNLFFLNTKHNVGAVIRALKSSGFFQSLAEPNLIAYNGQEASFLAGGEFPVPVVQGATGTVTILFKEFGVRLTFKPTIAGDVIRLKVRPEVSSLDFNNGITLAGFRIPALTTRRAETDVELRDGQSFAIAGLLDNISQEDRAGVPILSDLPIIGNLFKSKAERAERTELMVLITPRLVRPLDPDEVPPLPNLPRKFLPPADEIGQELEGGGGPVDAPPVETTPKG
jgi:pilus assembly protein CpaC